MTINLTDTSEPPVVNPATFTVAENSPNGTAVGTVTFTDGDAGQTHSFSILGGNTGGAFAIDPSTGAITVANSAALDFETTPAFSLTVQVTDNGSQSGTATVTINVGDVNEAPVVHPATFTLNENTPNGTVVGTVTFTDPDAGQAHTFAIMPATRAAPSRSIPPRARSRWRTGRRSTSRPPRASRSRCR